MPAGFIEDLEEDEQMSEKINVYLDSSRTPAETTDRDEDLPEGPSLEEMLEDSRLNADVEMAEQ